MLGDSDANLLLRLAKSRDAHGAPFLDKHHIAAANRLERLMARARLGPRLTMSYDPAAVGGSGARQHGAADIAESAAAARQTLNRLASAMPTDCWDVAVDVCGFAKGLQAIETERSWPRRSAKLVLRIALEQLALHWGLAPHVAPDQGRSRAWLAERLPLIEETEA